MSTRKIGENELYNAMANTKNADHIETKEEYLDLLEKVQQYTEDAGEGGVPINKLQNVLQKSDILFKKVLRPNEAKLDSDVLKHVGILGKVMIQKTQSGFITFKPADFADKIMEFVGGEGPDCLWSDAFLRVGKFSESFYKNTVGLIPLYGALEWKRPERAPTRERQAMTQEETVVLKVKQETAGATDKEQNSEDVMRVYNALKTAYKDNGKAILLLRFIINPDSFSETIHNMFHVSFLIRDGFARTYTGEDNLVVIVPVSRQRRETQPENVPTFQAIVDLDAETVEEAKKLLKIRRPMIPVAPSAPSRRNLTDMSA